MNAAQKTGIATGFAMCLAWYLLASYLGFFNFSIDQYRLLIGLSLLAIGILVTILWTKQKECNGQITFKEAAKAGVLTTLLASIMMGIFTYVFYKYINPDYVDLLISTAEKQWRAKNFTEERITKTIQAYRDSYTPIRGFMGTLMPGVVFSLILAVILKNKKEENAVTGE